MDQRIAQVLSLLIEDYIETAEPVGSSALVQTHGLEVSSATIRNWFADLEEEGFLIQPHTSAGRIPSESAFHWYVENRLGDASAKKKDRDLLKSAASDAADPVSEAKAYAKVCSDIVGSAAVVGSQRADSYYTGLTALFKQPEFHDWSRVVSMTSILDRLDDRLNQLRKTTFKTPTIRLGNDCPFGNACGSVIVTLPDNVVFVLLGPMRMDYKKARNVMTAVMETVA